MVELEKIKKVYSDKVIINNLSYKFNNFGLYLIKGNSGCGKTTLLNIISKRIKADEGKVLVKDSLFFLSYNDYLIDEIKVKEIIKLHKEMFKEFKSLKQSLDIERFTNKKISTLSLGEKQRLGLYLALSSNCKIVLLDEPLSGLDIKVKNKVTSILKKESKKKLIIIVSHEDIDIENKTELILKDGKFNNCSQIVIKETNIIDKKRGKLNPKWGWFLVRKQFILKILFMLSCLSIIGYVNLISVEIDNISEEFSQLYSDETIYYKDEKKILNEENFYDLIVSGLSEEVASYFSNIYTKEMYDSKVYTKKDSLGNGFLISKAMQLEGLKEDEVVLQINKMNFCLLNKIEYCGDNEIKERLIGEYLTYEYNEEIAQFKIKEVLIGESEIIYGDLNNLNSKISEIHTKEEIYKDYIIVIIKDKLRNFYLKINQLDRLQYYEFIKVNEDEKYTYFKVEQLEDSYFTSEEINENNLIACSEIGFSCNAFEFSKLKSLYFINSNEVKDKIFYKKYDYKLGYDQIVISSLLKEYLDVEIDEYIDLKFYIDNSYYDLINVRVVDIIESNLLEVYHSEYDYNLFSDKFDKSIRVRYVYGDQCANYKKRFALYYELVINLKTYIDRIILFMNLFMYIFMVFMFIFIFLVEINRCKKNDSFYKNIYFNNYEIKNIFANYMLFYLFGGLIFLFNYRVLIIYYFVFTCFYYLEKRRLLKKFN